MIPVAEKLLLDDTCRGKTVMSLIFLETEMSSENPEMSIRYLIKSVLLEVKALLQIQMQLLLLFPIQRIERVWVGALAID